MTESAVERLRHRVDLESDDPYVVSTCWADDVLTRIVPHDDLVEMADAFRALLSERAELLATVDRMRDKVEGLDSDLRCAVQVAYLRGATEWAKRNYPGMIEWLESCVTAHAALTTGEATTPNAGERG